MRKSILLSLLVACTPVAACVGDAPDGGYRALTDFVARSTPVECAPLDLGPMAVDGLRSVTDTSFIVLDAAGRRVSVFGDDLRQRWAVDYHERGPGAVDGPVDATLLGDTAVAVIARGGLRLVVLDRTGRPLRVESLLFVPNAIAAAGDELLLTAMPMGSAPASLLFSFRHGTLEEVPIPRRPYDDMLVGALGNSTLVEALPDGGALVVHQFLRPRALHVSPDRTVVTPMAVPIPDLTRELADAVPRAPITEAQFDQMLLPAMAMSVDRARREAYLLTRSGRRVDGRRERAVLRTDARLRYLASYLLDVNAVHLAVLPRRGGAVVADDADRVFLCPFDADAHAE